MSGKEIVQFGGLKDKNLMNEMRMDIDNGQNTPRVFIICMVGCDKTQLINNEVSGQFDNTPDQ